MRENSPYNYRDDIPVCVSPEVELVYAMRDKPVPMAITLVRPRVFGCARLALLHRGLQPIGHHTVVGDLEQWAGQMHQLNIAPNGVEKIYPYELGFPDGSLDRTSLSRNTFKLTASTPIVAYQFNPLDNVGVFSNDGSLLIRARPR